MNTSHIKKKKAFTLTELLVVVIVIGVLSAVVLPKFSKVMETRKTTEAEELMSAVRTEQEKRCTLDKNYLTQLTEIKDIVPAENTKNFAYNLTATGMEAQSKGKYGYTLKMPSYADGRICCTGDGCGKLNKNYPRCDDLTDKSKTPDYQSGAECAGIPPVIECTGSATRACGCKNGGTQTRTCDTSTGTWSAWSACSIADACSCEGESTRACGCQGKGTQTRTCDTSNGTWGAWGTCSAADACECTETKPMSRNICNRCGWKTREVTCDTSTGQWNTGEWSECDKTEEECDLPLLCTSVTSENWQSCCANAKSEDTKCFKRCTSTIGGGSLGGGIGGVETEHCPCGLCPSDGWVRDMACEGVNPNPLKCPNLMHCNGFVYVQRKTGDIGGQEFHPTPGGGGGNVQLITDYVCAIFEECSKSCVGYRQIFLSE